MKPVILVVLLSLLSFGVFGQSSVKSLSLKTYGVKNLVEDENLIWLASSLIYYSDTQAWSDDDSKGCLAETEKGKSPAQVLSQWHKLQAKINKNNNDLDYTPKWPVYDFTMSGYCSETDDVNVYKCHIYQGGKVYGEDYMDEAGRGLGISVKKSGDRVMPFGPISYVCAG